MNEFDKAAAKDKNLSEMMAEFADKLLSLRGKNLYNRQDLQVATYQCYDALSLAGFYLNTIWILKRNSPEDCINTALSLSDLARECNTWALHLAGKELVNLLFQKNEEILREGLERYPDNLKIKYELAKAIQWKNKRNKTDSYDEAVDLLMQIIDKGDNKDKVYIDALRILKTTSFGRAGGKLKGWSEPEIA